MLRCAMVCNRALGENVENARIERESHEHGTNTARVAQNLKDLRAILEERPNGP